MKGSIPRLLKLMAPFAGWILGGAALSAGAAVSSVGLMAVSAYLISRSAQTTQMADIAVAVTAVRAFAIGRASLRYAERYVSHSGTLRILTALRTWFYRAIEPLAPAGLQTYRSGDLLARIGVDIETLESFTVRVLIPPMAAVLVSGFTCLLLASYNPWLGLALLCIILLAGVGLPLLSHWSSQAPAAETIQARAELNSALVDEVQGLPDLLAFGQAEAYQVHLEALSERLNRAQERLALGRGLGDGLTALFASLAGLTVLVIAIPLVTSGALDGVYLAMLPLVAIACFEVLQPLTLAVQSLEASRAAARRLFTLIDRPAAVQEPFQAQPIPEEFDIRVDNLSFRYPQTEVSDLKAGKEPLAIEHLSFTIPSGSRTAIVGPSGSGKSTLVSLLLRFWEIREGSIAIGGQDIRHYRSEDLRALIGVAAQDTHLFNVSIRDNLRLANPEAGQVELGTACRIAQLEEFIASLPESYDTMVGENGVALSGGERQRLAIARAILKNAPIFILDEATSHLDAATEARLFQALDGFLSGRTTIIITHHPAGLPQVDQVIDLST